MQYQELELALADRHEVPEKDLGAFRARLRVLRDMGIPSVEKPGKGRKVEYDFADLWEASFALTLERFGLPHARVANVVARYLRKSDTIKEVRRKEKKCKADVWVNLLLLGFESERGASIAENPNELGIHTSRVMYGVRVLIEPRTVPYIRIYGSDVRVRIRPYRTIRT
jgi:hypothetical protein